MLRILTISFITLAILTACSASSPISKLDSTKIRQGDVGNTYDGNTDQSSSEAGVLLETTDVNGGVSALVSSTSDETQILPAGGSLAGSSASFPPGSLALESNVSFIEGGALASGTMASQLSLGTSFAATGSAATISSSEAQDAAQPFALSLPLPPGAGLHLADDYSKLIIVFSYKKESDARIYIGIYPRFDLVVEDGYVKFATRFFGTFQAAFTVDLVDHSIEIEPPTTSTDSDSNSDSSNNTIVSVGSSTNYHGRGILVTSFPAGTQTYNGLTGWTNILSSPVVTGGDGSLLHSYLYKNLH